MEMAGGVHAWNAAPQDFACSAKSTGGSMSLERIRWRDIARRLAVKQRGLTGTKEGMLRRRMRRCFRIEMDGALVNICLIPAFCKGRHDNRTIDGVAHAVD